MERTAHRKAGKFALGQIVWHENFNYRGVIYDVDPEFMLSDELYEKVAHQNPSRDQPWYRVLVDGTNHEAYVAEQHLREMLDAEPIEHDAVEQLFDGFEDGRYQPDLLMH